MSADCRARFARVYYTLRGRLLCFALLCWGAACLHRPRDTSIRRLDCVYIPLAFFCIWFFFLGIKYIACALRGAAAFITIQSVSTFIVTPCNDVDWVTGWNSLVDGSLRLGHSMPSSITGGHAFRRPKILPGLQGGALTCVASVGRTYCCDGCCTTKGCSCRPGRVNMPNV